MKISHLTFIVSNDCNFDCRYCFQRKEKKNITNDTVTETVNFFYPYLQGDNRDKIHIGFYGGEPLLAFQQIKQAVHLLQAQNTREKRKEEHGKHGKERKTRKVFREKNRKKEQGKQFEFFVTTNGSLLTDEKLDFFNRHGFGLMLSFDGLAQDKDRQKNAAAQMASLIKRIRGYGNIVFEINSVFTPGTVHMLCDSMMEIVSKGGPEVTFNLSAMEEWQPEHLEKLKSELQRLEGYLLRLCETGKLPVKNYQGEPGGVFRCGAGQGRMAVSPGGMLWGCFLFHDYFKTKKEDSRYRDYCFGRVAEFAREHETRYPMISAAYTELRQDFFQVEGTHCFLCEELESCMVCPLMAAYTTGAPGHVSCTLCRLKKIQLKS
ncbi:MAG: radical SAM protein, partial [bacterium]|nr:radical SAM protein [bacterium]